MSKEEITDKKLIYFVRKKIKQEGIDMYSRSISVVSWDDRHFRISPKVGSRGHLRSFKKDEKKALKNIFEDKHEIETTKGLWEFANYDQAIINKSEVLKLYKKEAKRKKKKKGVKSRK